MGQTTGSVVVGHVPWVDGLSILDDHLWHLDCLGVEDFTLGLRFIGRLHTLEAQDGLGRVALGVSVHR